MRAVWIFVAFTLVGCTPSAGPVLRVPDAIVVGGATKGTTAWTAAGTCESGGNGVSLHPCAPPRVVSATTADPDIARVSWKSETPTEFTIVGVGQGSTTVTVQTDSGEVSATVRVETADHVELSPECAAHLPAAGEPIVVRAGTSFIGCQRDFHGQEALAGTVSATTAFTIDAGKVETTSILPCGDASALFTVPGDATITSPLDPSFHLIVKTYAPGAVTSLRFTNAPQQLSQTGGEVQLGLEEDVPAGHPCANEAAQITVATPGVCKLAVGGVQPGFATSGAYSGAITVHAFMQGDCTLSAALVDASLVTATVTIPVH